MAECFSAIVKNAFFFKKCFKNNTSVYKSDFAPHLAAQDIYEVFLNQTAKGWAYCSAQLLTRQHFRNSFTS